MVTAPHAGKLNRLLREIEDGKLGFAQLAAECDEPQLKNLFEECWNDCVRALNALQKSVQSMGESAVQEASVTGTLRQGWIKLKSVVVPDQALVAIEEAEREHTRIADAFGDVLCEEDLPPAIRSTVEQENALIGKNLERLEQARQYHQAVAH
ncbi:MAG: hypothetical protein JWR07_4487 [Nevskia sp.]|nr:hypothetical protein [Nevskia sp.]